MKSKQVKKRYDYLAKIYDLLHHLQTLWADDKHRKKVIKSVPVQGGDVVLDVGTGTGLTAIMAAMQYPNSLIVGVDFSYEMLKQARGKAQREGLEDVVNFVCADASNLPFALDSFNHIISAYGLGGIEYIDQCLKEVKRVGKLNAKLAFAEMSETPEEYPIRMAIHKYIVGPWIRRFWNFRDLDLPSLLKKHKIQIERTEFFNDYLLGSTTLVSGRIGGSGRMLC